MSTKNKSSGTQHNPRGATQGVTLVAHENGLPINTVLDNNGVLRLAVDSNTTITDATINVDLDASTDNVAIRNSTNNNELLIQTDGSISVRLRDSSGNAINSSNPLAVEVVTVSGLDIEVSAQDGDNVAISAHPSQIFVEDEVGLQAEVFTDILQFTAVSDGSNIRLVEVTGTVNALVRVTLNGIPIRQKRINAGSPNVDFDFPEPRTISSGDIIRVQGKPDKAVPPFMGGANFFASLQGFID